MMRRTLLALLMGVGACNSTSTVGGMRANAASDWSCPESQIEVTNEGRDRFRVSGCGRTALYECVDEASPAPGGGPPQSGTGAEEEYRFQGAGSACHKVSRD